MEITWYIIEGKNYWTVQGDYDFAKRLAVRNVPSYHSLSNFLDPEVKKGMTFIANLAYAEERW